MFCKNDIQQCIALCRIIFNSKKLRNTMHNMNRNDDMKSQIQESKAPSMEASKVTTSIKTTRSTTSAIQLTTSASTADTKIIRFPVKLFYLIQQGDAENNGVCQWSNNGRNILINPYHPAFQSFLCQHFKRKYLSSSLILHWHITQQIKNV